MQFQTNWILTADSFPGSAIDFVINERSFFTNNFDGDRLVIDVSGDGIENSGTNTIIASNNAIRAGIDLINGIVIDINPAETVSNLINFYQNEIVRGTLPNGNPPVVFRANSFESFADVVFQKLSVEFSSDPLPIISIDNTFSLEGDTGVTKFTFDVNLSRPTTEVVTVDFATADDTAISGQDYTSNSGTITFNPGVTTQTITVNVAGDEEIENDEIFFVDLENAINANVANFQGTGIIFNDDPIVETPSISINKISELEGDTGVTKFTFDVNLSRPTTEVVTVDFATADDTAISGQDYTSNSGTITFNPGVITQTITVDVAGDEEIEDDEIFFVNLDNAVNADIEESQGQGDIFNDDFPEKPSISINNVSINEGDTGVTKFTFDVNLSKPTNEVVTVNFATADDTAISGQDYTSNSGTITFNPGVTTQTITVNVAGDEQDEPDETFFVNLNNPINANLAKSRGQGTITNDDDSEGGGGGDIHLDTFDGKKYDFQAVGDFIYVESPDNDFVIQIRLEPWKNNPNASISTAYSTVVDDRTVIFDLSLDSGTMTILIDGEETQLDSNETLAIENSQIKRINDRYTLTYAGSNNEIDSNDSQLIILNNGSHLDSRVENVGPVRGLLGNNDGDLSNEFTLRDGTQLSSDISFEFIHGEYADSWRVGNSESLFESSSPNSTGIPDQIIIDEFDAQDVKEAIKAVENAGIPRGEFFDNAVLDILITGELSFINSAIFIGTGQGDPHLTTFDGLKYDFHALGEYTFIKSADKDLEIQIATEPANGGKNSFITGIAANIGEDVIEFDPLQNTTVLVNGVPNVLTEETQLNFEGGTISFSDNRPAYTINYSSGETLVVYDVHSDIGLDFLELEFFPGDTEVVGLLGNKNGDSSDDIALRDGTVLTQPVPREIIDGELADSWAVSAEDSLFVQGETLITEEDMTFNISAEVNAGFANIGGFYQAIDSQGTVIDPLSNEEIAVGEEGYEAAALANSVTELGDGESTTVDLDSNLVYVPYLLANGTEFFSSFAEANADSIDHVQLISENSFGFEDLFGSGDSDFDDFIITAEAA